MNSIVIILISGFQLCRDRIWNSCRSHSIIGIVQLFPVTSNWKRSGYDDPYKGRLLYTMLWEI